MPEPTVRDLLALFGHHPREEFAQFFRTRTEQCVYGVVMQRVTLWTRHERKATHGQDIFDGAANWPWVLHMLEEIGAKNSSPGAARQLAIAKTGVCDISDNIDAFGKFDIEV